MIGEPLRQMFTGLQLETDIELLVQEYKRCFARNAPGDTRLLPGAELIPEFSRQAKLAVVTSRTSAGTGLILQSFGLANCFSAIVGIEDVERTKPDPEPVLLALQELGCPPGEAIFVGDTVHDMRAAERAGTKRIGVTTGPHSKVELFAAGAEQVIDSLHDLIPGIRSTV
jgi:HAD superfamily hydrolase (TIGR01509 family)